MRSTSRNGSSRPWECRARCTATTRSRSRIEPMGTAFATASAAVLPPRGQLQPRQFTGDPSPLLGKYKGPGHGGDMVVVVTQGREGVTFSISGQPAETLPWTQGWTFQKRDVLLSFHAGTTSNRA